MNVGTLIYSLDTLQKNIWGFLRSTHIIFMPSYVIHSRKEIGNSFVVKFFTGKE
jgi:hypothetical protein